MTEIAPYGTWKSPISAADVARGKMTVSFPAITGDQVWWQESRPAEGGRVRGTLQARYRDCPSPRPSQPKSDISDFGRLILG